MIAKLTTHLRVVGHDVLKSDFVAKMKSNGVAKSEGTWRMRWVGDGGWRRFWVEMIFCRQAGANPCQDTTVKPLPDIVLTSAAGVSLR